MVDVVLPDFDEELESATIINWCFEEGDPVEKGDDLVEVSGDMGAYKVTVPVSGILTERFFEEGDDVEVGEVLAVIEEE